MHTMLDEFKSGKVLLINKPYKWTSFDAVNKIKWAIKNKFRQTLTEKINPTNKKLPNIKVGHAGTLDPLATGLLIVCTGAFTKQIDTLQALEKEYTGTFFIGATTPCFDLEREIDKQYPIDHITPDLIYETAKKFTGTLQQIPPVFSAVHINGKRAYELARKGREVEMPAKTITISSFEITRIALPEVDFKVVCSKGTYIRSLARDFGEALNSGAHLIALCRTRIGNYSLNDAMSVEEFELQVKNEEIQKSKRY